MASGEGWNLLQLARDHREYHAWVTWHGHQQLQQQQNLAAPVKPASTGRKQPLQVTNLCVTLKVTFNLHRYFVIGPVTCCTSVYALLCSVAALSSCGRRFRAPSREDCMQHQHHSTWMQSVHPAALQATGAMCVARMCMYAWQASVQARPSLQRHGRLSTSCTSKTDIIMQVLDRTRTGCTTYGEGRQAPPDKGYVFCILGIADAYQSDRRNARTSAHMPVFMHVKAYNASVSSLLSPC